MKFKRYLVTALLVGVSVLAVGATVLGAGVSRAEEPEGVKLRQESNQSRGFFTYYRSHRGGGLHGGK